MQERNLTLFLISLLLLWLIGCGTLQTSNWVGFTDSLGTGSAIHPAEGYFNWRGEVEVRLTKADDPEWNPKNTPEYPYAGIMMRFRRSGKSVDISDSEGLVIVYKLDGRVDLVLHQANVAAGREYRLELPPQDDFARVYFSWDLFQQPSWVDPPTPMNLSQAVGIAFMNSAQKQSTAHLTISRISFPK